MSISLKELEKGVFLAFEGIDFSGKTTQLEKLQDRLTILGFDVFATREPGSSHSKVTQKIRQILLDSKERVMPLTELALFLADRAQHITGPGLVADQLKQKKVVLTDRQWAATVAYQVCGRELRNFKFIKLMSDFFASGVLPDLNLLHDLPPEIAQERKGRKEQERNRLDDEDLFFQARVRMAYQILAEKDPLHWLVFDATKSVEALSEEIFAGVYPLLKKFVKKKRRENG